MTTLVFAQAGEARLPLVKIFEHARRFFELSVNVLEETDAGARLEVELPKHAERGRFEIRIAQVAAGDLERARRAEQNGRAAGMSSLAERCSFVWQIEPEGEVSERLRLTLLGLLASVALGPVLPADDSTLYGVRGAMERAQNA